MTQNKKIDNTGLRNAKKEYVSNLPKENKADFLGIAGDNLTEPFPQYLSTPCEKIIEGRNNSTIVMGRDRTGDRLSGYGGQGHTQCGSIDVIVGRMGYLAREVNKTQELLWSDPNFKYDSARIYISQKTDVDDAFELAPGTIGNIKSRSSIGLKADQIRLIGREGIKIITGTDKRNSQGGLIESVNGIDLIAGNDSSDMQPLPKGNNLTDSMDSMVDHLQKILGIIDSFLNWQMKLNKVLISHTHLSPFYGLNTSPSLQAMKEGPNVMINHLQNTKMGIVNEKTNLVNFKHNYLSQAGTKYINSRYNNTN